MSLIQSYAQFLLHVTDLKPQTYPDIHVIVQRFGQSCDDIAHAYSAGICLPICLPHGEQ